MRKTRSLFILSGAETDVRQVLSSLEFKGLVSVQTPPTQADATAIFSHNKSIACSNADPTVKEFHSSPIIIEVVNNNVPSSDLFIDINKGHTHQQFEKIALDSNCDIGDHVSNSSGLTSCPTQCDCAYCKLLNQSGSQKILHQSPNFFIMTTLGAFIEGYLLVIPKKHIMSAAQLNTYELKREYFEVLQDAYSLIEWAYKTDNVIVFENGTGNSGKGKAKDSVVHAHTHLVISNLTADIIQKEHGIPLSAIHFNELANYSDRSYLLIHDECDIWKINSDSETYIPRQFVRQAIAEEYGINDDSWNWRTHPYRDKMAATDKRIIDYVKNHWSFMEPRIRNRIVIR